MQYVYAQNSSISDVDFNTNTALVHLDLYNNKVASLDVTQNPQLVYLDAALNRLSEIDLSRNPALVEISLGYNSIKSLDLSNNVSMSFLFATENPLMTKVYINQNSDYNTISVYEGVEVLYKYPGIYDNVSGEWGDDDVDPWK